MGKGFDFRFPYIIGDVFCFSFFGKYHRTAEDVPRYGSNCNAGGFYRQNFVNTTARIQTVKFFRHGIQKLRVNLVIEKTVDFQNSAGADDSILQNTLFKQFHDHQFSF